MSQRRAQRRALGLCVALAMTGCAAAPPAPPAPPASPVIPAEAPPPLTEARIQALIGEIAALRRLPQRAPIPIYILDEPAFLATLHRDSAPPSASQSSATTAFLMAFDLLPDDLHGRAPSTANEVLSEQILGFYDRERRAIFVRAARPRTTKESDAQIDVIAHEIEHALQDQSFPRPSPPLADLGADAELSRRAAVEGDAMLTMVAYRAGERGIPFGRAVRRVVDLVRDVSIDRLLAHEHGSALDRALPILRERLIFPYVEGTGLAADLYRAGGLELVNMLFTRPPASTEQVLHPEKYLAGEPPVLVRLPAPPPGYRVIAEETMGELLTRLVLGRCAPTDRAHAAAAGWGGDRYALLAGPADAVALVWSTAWDTEVDAAEFAAALKATPGCLRALQIAGRAIDGMLLVVREGRRVVVTRGLPEPVAQEVTPRIFALPADPPPLAPIGAYRIPPRAPLPAREPGLLDRGMYVSRWLGLVANVPSSFAAQIGAAPFELRLSIPGRAILGSLLLSDQAVTPRVVTQTMVEFERGFAHAARGRRLVFTGQGPVSLPLGPAFERTWAVEGTSVSVRLVVLSVCNGTGSYMFVQSWSGPLARTLLDHWLYSFRWMAPGYPPPVCGMLNPP